MLLKSGFEEKGVVFYLEENDLKSDVFYENIESILNSGTVPNIFQQDEIDKICGEICSNNSNAAHMSKSQLMNSFYEKVKKNLHIFLAMKYYQIFTFNDYNY